MAGFVSRKSADRWNRTASIVEGGGAGWRRVPGLYRPPQGSRGCPDGLSPGSYRAVAGGTIGPGETGPIIITGCDGEEMLDAVNQTECTFYLGNRITAFIDPCCNVHFTGCAGAEPACCEQSAYVCIGGEGVVIPFDGGTHTFDVSHCCDCEGAEIVVTIACESSTPTATWAYICGDVEDGGTIDLTALCDLENDVEILDEIEIAGCTIADSWSNFAKACISCVPVCCECTVAGVPSALFGVEMTQYPDVVCEGQTYEFRFKYDGTAHTTLCGFYPTGVWTFESGNSCFQAEIISHNMGDIITGVNGETARWRCGVDGTPPTEFVVEVRWNRVINPSCDSQCFGVVARARFEQPGGGPFDINQFQTITYSENPCGPGPEPE
jgi:hypothetical protein